MNPNSPREAQVPDHIAIIMDGNGRWAKARGLPRIAGHDRGADAVRTVTRACRRLGVKALTLYAFSEQNWGRPTAEVAGLMRLLARFLRTEWSEICDNGVRLVTIGDQERLPAFVRAPLDALTRASAANQGMVLCLALSYGGREQIAAAARRLAERVARGELSPSDVTTARLDQEVRSEAIPWDPDLVIRTSGEQRLSNFLLWESAYAELYFTDTPWPDFGEEELMRALSAYRARERRFGLVGGPEGRVAC
ncbi:MAG: isoprenyl transferase [Myxococcales bacterium]